MKTAENLKYFSSGELLDILQNVSKAMMYLGDLQQFDGVYDEGEVKISKYYLQKCIDVVNEIVSRTGDDALSDSKKASLLQWVELAKASPLYATND